MPEVRVSPWLVVTMTVLFAGSLLLIVRAVFAARHAPVTTGIEALVGRVGTAISDLAPAGIEQVDSEEWSAFAEDGAIPAGEDVQILGVSGVTLTVKRHHRRGSSRPAA